MSDVPGKALTLQELPDMRRKTDAVARFLKEQLTGHVETLRPLLAPEHTFGKAAGSKSTCPERTRR